MRGWLFLLLLLCSGKAFSQSADTLSFVDLVAVDTMDSSNFVQNFSDTIKVNTNDFIGKNIKDNYFLFKKGDVGKWIVYELPDFSYGIDTIFNGRFLLYKHSRGNSTRSSSWYLEETYVIDLKMPGYFSIETDNKLESYGDNPVRLKKESRKHFNARVRSAQATTITHCAGYINISKDILTIERKCGIEDDKTSKKANKKTDDLDEYNDAGTYRYSDGSFVRINAEKKKGK